MELEPRDGITVAELIDMLSEHPADAIVELSIVAPVTEGDSDITVDRFNIDGIMPWSDDGTEENVVVWLVGGEDDDVDVFLEALESGGHDDHDHDGHDHDHDHDGHDHDHSDHESDGHSHDGPQNQAPDAG